MIGKAPLGEFVASEAAGSLVLMGCAALALIVCNTPLGPGYEAALHHLRPAVDDGLMALFFLLVGLEIKRELVRGELAGVRKAALPILGALGGMALPAAIYLLWTRGTPYGRGWGIPIATDIAFAVGVLTLLRRRVPPSLQVFLTALAIADDLGAVVVIVLFYAAHPVVWALALALGLAVTLVVLNRAGVRRLWPYLVVGVLLWIAVYRSGVHATIAGVALGMSLPCDRAAGAGPSPLERLEHALEPWIAFVVLPLFALTNAGVALPWRHLGGALLHPVTMGVFVGLVVGKVLGVFGSTVAATRAGWGTRPSGASTRQLFGAAALAGIGFTMSIFVATLAFGDGELLDAAKIGVIAASLVSALIGSLVLRFSR